MCIELVDYIMGRKEYFDRLDELRLLRKSITSKSERDPYFISQPKEIFLGDIEEQINRLRLVVQ
jgi:hypothetical protein